MHHVEILADKQLYLTNAVCAPKLRGGLYVKEGKKKRCNSSRIIMCVCVSVCVTAWEGGACERTHAFLIRLQNSASPIHQWKTSI